MKKKHLCTRLFAILISFLLTGFTAYGDVGNYIESGNWGGDFGNWGMWFDTDTGTVLSAWRVADGNLVIPETIGGVTVRKIGANAFYLPGIISVVLPETVEEIEYKAFSQCENLESVTFSGNSQLKKIGDEAFAVCEKITSITLPEGLEEIGARAFWQVGIETITIPSSVKYIGEEAFMSCSSLTDVVFNGSEIAIETGAFSSAPWFNSLQESQNYSPILFVKNNEIAIVSFSQFGEDLIIPDGVKSVACDYYYYTTNSSECSIIIPESVVTVAGSVGNITKGFVVDSANPYLFAGSDGVLYNKDKTRLISAPNFRDSVTIPDTVKVIGRYSFKGNTGLSSLVIPDSVEIIEPYALRNTLISEFALSNNLKRIENHAFAHDGYYLIERDSRIEYITLPESLEYIGVGAFEYCRKLKTITIPAGVKELKKITFWACDSIDNVVIKGDLSRLWGAAFGLCPNLKKVTFEGNAPSYTANNPFLAPGSGFTVYYNKGAEGFTSPTWYGYDTVELGFAPSDIQATAQKTEKSCVVSFMTTNSVENAYIMVALYDGDNKLLVVKIRTDSVGPNNMLSETFTYDYEAAKYAKVFVLDSIDGIQPLMINGYVEIQ